MLFDNYFNESNGLKLVQASCQREGLSLDVAGVAAGRPISRPEDLLGQYDIVFASGRCALESLAVGAAVIVCGVDGCGPMVDPANLASYRRHNFGLRAYERPLDADYLARQIRCYDPVASGEVSRRIRAQASLDHTVDVLLELYAEVIEEWGRSEKPCPEDENAAVLRYLEG